MTDKEKAKAYDEALKYAKMYYKENKDYNAGFLPIIFPELAESEDERIRKSIIHILQVGGYMSPEEKGKAFAYLEKQKENIEKEYVFRPLAGTDITVAAEQAIRRANEGDRLVLAFNGAYIPVRKGCNANKIVDIYNAFIEKQKEPHYTKRNALFDKCVENCEPEVMKSVSDEVDEMLEKEKQKEQEPTDDKAFEEWIDDWWKHNKVNNPDSYDKGDEIQFDEHGFKNFCRGIRNMYQQKLAEWSEDWREEDIQTRFAFYTYKNAEDDGVLYLSNVFVEEASRNHGFGTKILAAAEKVAETIGATTICLKVKQDSPANAWYRKNGYGYVAFEDGYDWLEKNLEYMKPQPKQEWSAKGRRGRIGTTPEHIRKKAENFLFKMEPPYDADDICSAYETGAMENANPSWSEEDEAFLKVAIAICNRYSHKDIADWLKSLCLKLKKENEEWRHYIWTTNLRFDFTALIKYDNTDNYEIVQAGNRPRQEKNGIYILIKDIKSQPHWKPSEEQMEALKCAIADVAKFSKRGGRQVELENEPYYSALHLLYEQLEKLI